MLLGAKAMGPEKGEETLGRKEHHRQHFSDINRGRRERRGVLSRALAMDSRSLGV